jgi:LysR family transcriptional regulator, transcriptional activator of the cysJI operon
MRLEAQLRAFAAFARRSSFSGAAQDVRISQPAVSRHIADLERELGVLLVERRWRKAELTAAGAFLANHVLRAEAILAQASLGISEFRTPGRGSLAIVASGVSGTYLLPEIIAQFHEAHPGIRVSLELGTSARAVEVLRSHRAELGVVGGFVAAPEIEAEPLLENEMIVVGPRRLAGRRLAREDLEALTWISREEGSATRALVEATFDALGITPQRRLELPSWEAIKLMVRRGYGVAACSRFAVDAELRAGVLTEIPIRGWKVRNTTSIIRARDAALTPTAQQFLETLRGQMPKLSSRRASQKKAATTRLRSRPG